MQQDQVSKGAEVKYYLFLKIIFIVLLLGLPAHAAILTSDATPNKIFKCGASTISTTFDDGGVTTVDAILTSEKAVIPDWSQHNNQYTTQSTTVSLTNNGTYWVGTFGNDANLLWGNRLISYRINGATTYSSSSSVFVYSDVCTTANGTVSSYTQMPFGFGRYTRMLYNGQFTFFGTSFETSIIGWALYPWVEIFGYVFYLLLIFTICTTVYLKTQNITQPLAIGVFLLMIFASTFYIETMYRKWIIIFIALGLTALYYRTFVRD